MIFIIKRYKNMHMMKKKKWEVEPNNFEKNLKNKKIYIQCTYVAFDEIYRRVRNNFQKNYPNIFFLFFF